MGSERIIRLKYNVENMKRQRKFMYDDTTDRLFISAKKDSDKIYGSVRMLNLILDVTADMRVVNIELIDASDYLSSLDIDSAILDELEGADFVFKQVRNGYLIGIVLRSEKTIARIPYNVHIPSEKQIVLNAA